MAHSPAPRGDPELQEVLEWMMHYYERPDPGQIPRAIDVLARAGILAKQHESPAVFSFFATLIQHDPYVWLLCNSGASLLAAEQQMGLVYILWLSNSDDARFLLGVEADWVDEDQRPPNLLKDPVDSPEMLDLLWGAFFATGEPSYIKRITEALVLDGTMLKIATRGAAQWSLLANAKQHPRVLDACRLFAAMVDQPDAIRSQLRAIIQRVSS